MPSLAERVLSLGQRIMWPPPLDSKEDTLSVPKPEVIDVKTHPLCHYPKFAEFAASWNTHASSVGRLELQTDVQACQQGIYDLPDLTNTLRQEIERLEEQRQRQKEIFDAKKGSPREQEHASLKTANRDLRRTRERLERLTHQEEQASESARKKLDFVKAALFGFDGAFALSLDKDGANFFLAERLRGDQKAADQFLVNYCRRSRTSIVDRRIDLDKLWSLNYRSRALLQYYGHRELPHDELTAIANEATARQSRMAGMSI